MQAIDEKFMKLAIEKAREGIKKGQAPFGACIVKDGKIISCVHNIVWESTDITAHAEVNAIRKACKKLNAIDLSGCVIYSTCEPCPMCYSAINWARINKIVFGCGIEDAKAAGFHEIKIHGKKMHQLAGDKTELIPGFLKEECKSLFDEWSKRKDKKPY